MSKPDDRAEVTSSPAGTGNVPGLGEAFRINLNTGQGVYSYKLPLPDGVAGHQPNVTLEYGHGSALGSFGLGWKLPVRNIARRLDLGVPQAGVAETFHDGGTELAEMPDGSFAPLVDTAFTRYKRTDGGWSLDDRNGVLHELGLTPATRVSDPANSERVQEYLLERSVDPNGNEIRYTYLADEGWSYLQEIRYAAYAVRLVYESRPDARRDGRAGWVRLRRLRCARIELYLDPGATERRIRSWSFTYETDAVSGVSLLAAIRMVSHGLAADGSQDVGRAPIAFRYVRFNPSAFTIRWMESSDGPEPPPLSDAETALVTLDSAPLPGILQVSSGRQWYWRNQGDGTWGYPQPVRLAPSINSFAQAGVALMDTDGSGTADLITVGPDPLHGYYENGGALGWSRFVAYPRGSRSTPSWTSGRIRLTDADGDGVIDAVMSSERSFTLWINHGPQGWSEPILTPRETEADGDEPGFADPLVFLADMNGDGLDDLVRLRSGRVEYRPGLGHARFGAPVLMTQSPRLANLENSPGSTFLMDVNGDGCADLVRISAEGVSVYFNRNGAEFGASTTMDTIPPPISGSVRRVNMSGQTRAGLLWNSPRGRSTGYVQLEFGEAAPANLLNHIDNGAGLISELFYRWAVEDQIRDFRDGERWTTNLPFPLAIVAGSRETDQVSGQVTATQYRYHEGHFQQRTRQFQGFRRAERIETGDESRADVCTEFVYLMAEETKPGNGPEHAALNGLQQRTATFSLDGTAQENLPYRVEECTYELQPLGTARDGRKRIFYAASVYRTEDHERTADLRVEEKTYSYDAFGNVTLERLRGSGTRNGAPVATRERVTEIEYAVSGGRYIVDRPSRVVVRDETNAIISEKRRYYDGPAFVGLALGQVDRGRLTRDEQLVLTEAEFTAHYAGMDAAALGYHSASNRDGTPSRFVNTERNSYDALGVKIAERDALNNQRDYEYDASHLLRTKLQDPLGQTRFEYDRATAQPTRVIYPDGAETRFQLDAQGRILSNLLPGDDAVNPPRMFTYDDLSVPNSRQSILRPSAGVTASTVTYFDGRGKEFQQRVEAEPGRFTVSGVRLKNPWGDVKQEYEPTNSASVAFSMPVLAGRPCRSIFFDGRARPVRTVDFNAGESRAEYRPFEVILHDANDTDGSAPALPRGHFQTPRHEEFDVFRNRTRVVEELGGGQTAAISYTVNAAGDLMKVTDLAGDLCAYRYDRMGRRLAAVHREAGERKLFYDGRGKVVRALDAAGNDLRAELDPLGRLRRLTLGATVLEDYSYDDTTRNAVGRLAAVTYLGGSQRFRYDTAGRTVEKEYRFDGVAQPHTMRYEFDGLGRETAIVHSDGTRFDYQLTTNGLVRSIPGILNEVTYDPRGLPTRITYANNVVTELTYTDGPARVSRQRTTGPADVVLEDSTFTYDPMRMLLSQVDASPGGDGSRTFTYDPLYQIKRSVLTEGGGPVTRDYQYTNHWNLNRLDESGRVFHYDDAAHPNRIAGLTEGAQPRVNLSYDTNGNLLSLPGRTFAYNAKNELDRFTAPGGVTAEYRYDHEGIRISKSVTTGGATVQTLFVGRWVEIRGGTATHLVHLGEMRIAILRGTNKRFVHSNYLGNTSFFTDAAGTKIASIAYRPFGNVGSTTGVVDLRTFGSHPYDEESGLFYMRRRYYAPELGRFLTPDPLALFKPQRLLDRPRALHPYAYSGNDPVNNADPDGLSFWSVVGAIVGVIVGVALAALVVMTGGLAGILIGAGLLIGLMAVSYVVADATAGTAFGEFMRGFMIGVNAGMNAVFATMLFGPVIGIALGVINFLAAVDEVASNPIYQGILGWSSWLMPMSWLATGVGLVVFVINLIVGFFAHTIPTWFGGTGWDQARINSVSVDWGTGTIVMHGGMFTVARGGYNLGNFAYIHKDSAASAGLVGHETGHTLNVAAYGSIFHYIGAIDENVVGRFAGAYAERLADSHDPTRTVADATVWQEVWV